MSPQNGRPGVSSCSQGEQVGDALAMSVDR